MCWSAPRSPRSVADRVNLTDGRTIPAELIVWAAGIKAPDFLKDIAGLETNRINQLVVRPTLQTTRDDDIFAIGDCSACSWGERGNVPPRAQAAHQQASHLYSQIPRYLQGEPLKDYRYRDFGSLVSLGEFSTVGSMMGALVGGNLVFEGIFAQDDVPVSLQDARTRAARFGEGGARHAGPPDHPAHRAAREAALIAGREG